jgi:CBS domain-containing protein
MMNVQTLMTANPAVCTSDMPVRDVAKMMLDHDCGQIPVVDNIASRRAVGVVTDRDIATRVVATGKDLSKTTAGDCMSAPCISVGTDTSLRDCCLTMESNKIRRVPVVDANGSVRGILSLADVARGGGDAATIAVVKEVSAPA